jgi:hypothetical protein
MALRYTKLFRETYKPEAISINLGILKSSRFLEIFSYSCILDDWKTLKQIESNRINILNNSFSSGFPFNKRECPKKVDEC